jgi:glycolate oxidase iron-sulfur subunit
MVSNGYQPEAAEPLVVTYHDPCHMRWHQGIREQPRQLLQSIDGIKYVEMEGADECCGLGGSFSLTHRDTSLAILDKKMESIKKTGAKVVVTSCPGCIVQLRDGARRHGMDIEVRHISEIVHGQKEPPQKPR